MACAWWPASVWGSAWRGDGPTTASPCCSNATAATGSGCCQSSPRPAYGVRCVAPRSGDFRLQLPPQLARRRMALAPHLEHGLIEEPHEFRPRRQFAHPDGGKRDIRSRRSAQNGPVTRRRSRAGRTRHTGRTSAAGNRRDPERGSPAPVDGPRVEPAHSRTALRKRAARSPGRPRWSLATPQDKPLRPAPGRCVVF